MAAAHLSVLSENPIADAESLADWLRGEPVLAGRVRLTGQGPKQGELGSALDTLTVALGAGGTGTALVACLRTWLAQPRRSDVRLKVRREGRTTVEIDAKRVRGGDLERLLREALEDGLDSQDRDVQE